MLFFVSDNVTSVTTKKSVNTFSKDQEKVAKYYVFLIKKRVFLCFKRFLFLNRFKSERSSDLFIRPFCEVLMAVISTALNDFSDRIETVK